MAVTTAEFDYLRALVRTKAGIVLEAGKEYLVDARVSGLLVEAKLPTVSRLIERLRASSGDPLHQRLIEVMTTNETSFFRDQHPFEAFGKTILPALMAARASTRTLSLWCGATATGQEPYTVAMTMLESVPRLADWTISFLCTDISGEMIARSKAGRYSQLEVNRGLPPALLSKYFVKDGTEWQAHKRLRDMLEFREMNLTQPWPTLPAMDIVFLRNVLIYFDQPTKKEILGRIRRLLRADGVLFLGSGETTLCLDEEYERVAIDRSGCYRKKPAAARAA